MNAPLRLRRNDESVPLLEHEVRYLGGHGGAFTDLEPDSLRTHLRRFGPRPQRDADDLIADLERLALTGRGGGHFPAARKWRAAQGATGPVTVVANGAEGEPLSRKDTALLELRPHLVLDGLASAAEALDAEDAVIWLHEGDHPARSAVARALAERPAGDVALRLAVGPDHYLTGETSAVVRGLAGGPALPTFRRVPLARGGRDGRAVLVHNVETLARIGLVARGIEPAESVLVSVGGPGAIVVLEAGPNWSVLDAARAGSGDRPVQAVLLGGYGGSWLSRADAARLPLHEPALRAAGVSVGAGVIEVLPDGRCGIARAAAIARFLADSSARQCGPCLFGLDAIADSMAALAKGGRRHRREADRVRSFVADVRGRGACHHPDGAARMVTSALEVFTAEVDEHLHGRCRHA
ncbi:MAG TPA: NADH-ubiquinone oxidoreductase-F iron-sulfur binding region domain-containing protein [Jatrophihabitans sp.]|jgi:NADH:ubiquinone oxidoreductase subunit F (NADH-binding)|uniref:NADH-ubiquinone oxidoreductase-F iron-sulfur binding region domain-containing protein n=1 Tax=Jatrophihabitans sp. TaxID=1932789 RepID=UPI002E0BEDD9|nr:NADH-ubiquinone oxidoreductase-F iron-sulfur binding region domain-containing protein [Jatrophihabitans sp.]